MFDYDVIENGADSEEQYFEELQKAINSLVAWRLQGSYGRTMMQALQDGKCMLGHEHTHDYWGSRIPARDKVKAGTVGSFELVARINGLEYANRMASL